MRLPIRLLTLKSRRRAQRGQAIILGSLSFLVLALMVTLSFNLGHALRQKMGLQQHSDALAYSMAVLEARALNYYAVSNRAIAASYVAMNSVHAYMAAASVTGQMMRASQKNFNDIATIEAALCASCKTCFIHCIHALEARQIAGKFSRAGRDYDQKVRGLESNFNSAVRGLDVMVDNLHASQRTLHTRTRQAVQDGRNSGLDQLTRFSAPDASNLSDAVGGLNANEFDCAVDGMECRGSVASSSTEARAKVMTEIANATRSGWPASRKHKKGFGISVQRPNYLHSQFFRELRDIPNRGTYLVTSHQGTAKTVDDEGSIDSPGQRDQNPGRASAAQEEGTIFHQWRHGVGTNDYTSRVWSDCNGGGHDPNGAHSGSHTFQGVNANSFASCARTGNCFMKFRANPSSARDWGQPRVYSSLTRPLRMGDPSRAPWELNASAQIRIGHGEQGEASLSLAAQEGTVVSKALVYYHRFGPNGWREAPTLFSPYWRAKLHPISSEEAAEVLDAAGNSDGARLARVPGVSL
ncbi:hypothetical protein A176_005815 [Myxococcus hansupus]|uniref:Uncharacterized protein n=1 Tax=Pseudomyxococcus hansupus TaxID=1297742 RepID=A0A0H4X4Y4_9BACT|nr:hypothetical protein [Myxococcus hansupus]AKQ68903.1 hypothetical protein A176_005815 [Myxococcus hansupus]